MSKQRTYAADIEAGRNPREAAEKKSADVERAAAKSKTDERERARADALAAAASKTGQT
ncbi:hypothetical protein [Sphingomonas sp. PR090111-T3T-6A]|uniref:hypothetical protein n=1 Tax=Sphingomonas sp. PR090111-T3T-6A TaxID=685778 RepID=UPI0003798410|nr:hypothetical protein [Sphingomonas sp. PR090111-T3T-6A]